MLEHQLYFILRVQVMAIPGIYYIQTTVDWSGLAPINFTITGNTPAYNYYRLVINKLNGGVVVT